MQLVDEDDDLGVLDEFLHDGLEPLFELTAILRTGYHRRDVELEDPLVGEESRHLAADNSLGQALDQRRLANAGLADQHGVVLGAAAKDLHRASKLGLATNQRIKSALGGHLGQIARELRKEGSLLLLLAEVLLLQQEE